MKLSEAIRRGILQKPEQAFGVFFKGDKAACAMGAAIVGSGFSGVSELSYFQDHFKAVLCERVQCPKNDGLLTNIEGIVTHLNDDHKMSRGDIADWIEECRL